MKTVSLLLLPSVLGYLDFTVFQVDQRYKNEENLVNPYQLVQQLYYKFYLNVSTSASNDIAWMQLRNVLTTTYPDGTGMGLASIVENAAITINDYLAANQELYVGRYIDMFNYYIGNSRNFTTSNATIRGIQLIQAGNEIFYKTVLMPLSIIFYNPFDTEMISTLNSSQVFKVNGSLFDLFRNAYYYMPYPARSVYYS